MATPSRLLAVILGVMGACTLGACGQATTSPTPLATPTGPAAASPTITPTGAATAAVPTPSTPTVTFSGQFQGTMPGQAGTCRYGLFTLNGTLNGVSLTLQVAGPNSGAGNGGQILLGAGGIGPGDPTWGSNSPHISSFTYQHQTTFSAILEPQGTPAASPAPSPEATSAVTVSGTIAC